jgi:hypothetical protein
MQGILQVQFSPREKYCRLRVIFYAEPVDVSQLPKSIPDYESVGATWIHYNDLSSGTIPLRGSEPLKWSRYLLSGGTIYPLAVLGIES